MATSPDSLLPTAGGSVRPPDQTCVQVVRPGGYDVLQLRGCSGTIGANLLAGSAACQLDPLSRTDLVTVDVAFAGGWSVEG
jgi:hypothetical protein